MKKSVSSPIDTRKKVAVYWANTPSQCRPDFMLDRREALKLVCAMPCRRPNCEGCADNEHRHYYRGQWWHGAGVFINRGTAVRLLFEKLPKLRGESCSPSLRTIVEAVIFKSKRAMSLFRPPDLRPDAGADERRKAMLPTYSLGGPPRPLSNVNRRTPK